MILYLPYLRRGVTLMPVLTLIPQWVKYDLAYRMHEQVHAAQQRRIGILMFWYRYITDRSFRQQMEVEAYQTQIIYGASISYCAGQLVNNYNLKLDWEAALKLLSS